MVELECDIFDVNRGFEEESPSWFSEFLQIYKTYNVTNFDDLKVFLKMEFITFEYSYEIGTVLVITFIGIYYWVADQDELWIDGKIVSERFKSFMRFQVIWFGIKDPDDFYVIIAFSTAFSLYYGVDPTMSEADIFDDLLNFVESSDFAFLWNKHYLTHGRETGEIGWELNDWFFWWKDYWYWWIRTDRDFHDIHEQLSLEYDSRRLAALAYQGPGYRYYPCMRDVYDVSEVFSERYDDDTIKDIYIYVYMHPDFPDPKEDAPFKFIWWTHSPYLVRVNPYTLTQRYAIYDSYLYYNFFLLEEDNMIVKAPWEMGTPGNSINDVEGLFFYDLYREPDVFGPSSEFVKWLDTPSLDPEHRKNNFNLILEGPVGNKIRQFKLSHQ